MSRPIVRELDLQALVKNWWLRLYQHYPLNIASPQTDSLSRLSLRKRDKGKTIPQEQVLEKEVSRTLLRLLARRVFQLTLHNYDSNIATYPLYCFEGVYQDCETEGEISEEIASLAPPLLTAENLATLQLSDLHINYRANKATRKRTGGYYTPPQLARYITDHTLDKLSHTPILDPACGSGIFLVAALEVLHKTAPHTPPAQLLTGTLYGLDLNPDAADLTRLSLLLRAAELGGKVSADILPILWHQVRAGNTLVGGVGETIDLAALPIFDYPDDGKYLASLSPFSWAEIWPEVFNSGGFGAVLGNPPYIGFNDYSGVEKAYFAHVFPQVYNLKADMLYYFIFRGVALLREGGRLGFVTTRFWKEAVFAARLRQWLAQHTRLLDIEDRGAEQLFAEAEVDSCLLFLEKTPPTASSTLNFSFNGQTQSIPQTDLSGAPWAFLRRLPAEEELLGRIMERAVLLGDIAECRTGAQTGLDEVFAITAEKAAQLEPEAVRPALKSGDITAPGQVEWRGRYLIYLPTGSDIADFPKLAAYLEPYRAKLERRLRYRKAFPYYELQWPRTRDIFEVPGKLITPYKAPRNWFALDTRQMYFSTDVVSVVFTPEVGVEGLHMAMNFLNSSLSTWQFRSYSKQVGGGQYDYYANPLKHLAFPTPALLANNPLLSTLGLTLPEIDLLVFEMFGLNGADIDLVGRH